MSKQIENNVVQMSFDNRDFEKNISTSSKSIEKLNEQLKFKDASEGFKDIEKYANSVNFDGLNKAISNINSVFTVTGNLTKKIIDDIAGYFESKIVSAVRAVTNTSSYIMDLDLGIAKYEEYTTAVNTMQGNLSDLDRELIQLNKETYGINTKPFEYAEEYIEQMALYTDETSYSLTDMVSVMAKFAASNVDLKQSSKAMMGFANMAAVAGQNATTANMAMNQMAQAFSTGYLKYQDWAQAFASKNIATKEAKQVFVNAALEAGTLDKKDIEKAKAAMGDNWTDFFFTSEMMSQGWLRTSDVLVKGLQEYSKASDYILENMEKVSEDASVTDLVVWVDDFKNQTDDAKLSAKEFAEQIADSNKDMEIDVEALAKALETLGSEEYALSVKAFKAAQQATNFHEAIDAARDAVGTKMMYAMKYFIGDLEQASKLWTKFSNSLWDIFAGPLDATLAGLKAWNKGLLKTDEGVVKITDDYEKFWTNVARFFGGLGDVFGGFINQIRFLSGSFEEINGNLKFGSIIEDNTLEFMQKITRGVENLADLIEKFLDSKFYKNLLGIFRNVLIVMNNFKKVTTALFDATIGTIIRNLGGPLTEVSNVLLYISDIAARLTTKLVESPVFKLVIDNLSNIIAKLMKLGTLILKNFGSSFISLLEKIGKSLSRIFEKIGPAFVDFFTWIGNKGVEAVSFLTDHVDLLGQAFDFVVDKVVDAWQWVRTFFTDLTGYEFGDIIDKLKELGHGFMEGASGVGGRTLEVLKQYGKGVFDKNTAGSIPNLISQLKEVDTVGEGARTTIAWMGDALSNPIQLVFDLVGAVMNTDLSKAADILTGFIKRITGAIANLSPGTIDFLKTVMSSLKNVVMYILDFIARVVKFSVGAASTTGFGIVDKLLAAAILLLDTIVDAFVYLVEALIKISEYLKPAFFTLVDYLEIFVKKIVDAMVDMAKTLNEASPGELVAGAIGLAIAVGAIFIIVNVFYFLIDIIWAIKGIGGATKKIALGFQYLAESVSDAVDTIAGNNVAGMISRLTILLFAIGYAMSGMVKMAEGLADEKKASSYAVAIGLFFAMLIGVMVITKKMLTNATKQAAAIGKDLTAGHAVATALTGIGIAMIGISIAMKNIAKIAHDYDPDSVQVAAGAILVLTLGMALFLRIVRGEGESHKGFYGELKEISSIQKGTSYNGVASAIRSLAIGITIIMLAFSVLVKAVAAINDPSILWQTFGVVFGLMMTLAISIKMLINVSESSGILKDMSTFQSKKGAGGVFNSVGIAMIITAMTSFVIIVMGAIVGLAAVIQVFHVDLDLILFVSSIMFVFIMALGLMIRLIYDSAGRMEKLGVKQLLARIAKMITISLVFTTLAVVISVIAIAVKQLTKVVKDTGIAKFTTGGEGGSGRGDVPKEHDFSFIVALGTIVGLMILMQVMIHKLVDVSNKVDPNKLLAVALLMTIVTTSIRSLVRTFTKLMKELSKAKGIDIGLAAAIMGAIIIALGGFMALMIKMVQNLRSGILVGGGDPAPVLLAIGAAILMITIAISKLCDAFVKLSKALKTMSAGTIIKGFITLIGLMASMAAVVILVAKAAQYLAPAITSIAIGLAALTVVVLLAILLMDHIGESGHALRDTFYALGKAVSDFIVGLVDGIVEGIPELLEALGTLINNILDWVRDNISGWMEKLVEILIEAIDGLATGLEKDGDKLGAAIVRLAHGIWNVFIGALNALAPEFGDFINNLFADTKNMIVTFAERIEESAKEAEERIQKLMRQSSIAVMDDAKENVKPLLEIQRQIEETEAELEKFREKARKAVEDNGVVDFEAQFKVDELSTKLADLNSQIETTARNIYDKLYGEGTIADLGDILDELGMDFNRSFEENLNIWGAYINESGEKIGAGIRGTLNWETLLEKSGGRMPGSFGTFIVENDLYKITPENHKKFEEEFASIADDVVSAFEDPALADRFRQSGTDDVNAYIDSVRGPEGFDSHSPSKVMEEVGRDVAEGFDMGIFDYDVYEVGVRMALEFLDGLRTELDIHSPSKKTEEDGEMAVAGFEKGASDTSSIKEAGANVGKSFVSGLTNRIKNISSVLDTSSIKDKIVNSLGLDGITDSLEGIKSSFNLDSLSSNMNTSFDGNIDMSGAGYTNVPNYADMMNTDLDLNAGLTTTVTDQQVNQLGATVSDSNKDLIDEVKGLREEMANYAEAIQQIKMYLDTGVLVGELTAPIDKALGERNARKAARNL